jgi:DNA invertase Pin-like site-specific DNA recombinase
MQTVSSEEASRMIYEARLKADRDLYSRIQGAFREGLEKGREKIRRERLKEGLEEGEAKATRRMIFELAKKRMGINDIAAITHLSEQEVSRILEEGNG